MLFGKVCLYRSDDTKLGQVTLGWTLGEEILFSASNQIR